MESSEDGRPEARRSDAAPTATIRCTLAAMPKASIQTLFWDVGGVLLTNGWDRHQREAAAERFGLELNDFDYRHEAVVRELETGGIGVETYLDSVVFCRPRDFSREEFLGFMRECSEPCDETLAIARSLSAQGAYRMATLNNESTYLNEYRIENFNLDSIFELFFSSCYVGMTKPSGRIFELAAAVTRTNPAECLFIDDRSKNAEAARDAGLQAIHHDGNAAHLVEALGEYGVEVGDPTP